MGITEKIYLELKKKLEQNSYQAGSKFPSESQLAEEFSVNKMTMNKIVSRLAGEGYLIRGVRGAGTRVAHKNAGTLGSIAFLSPLSPYAVRILQGVYAEAKRQNFSVIIETPAVDEIFQRLQLLQSSGICGVISVAYGLPAVPENLPLFCVDNEPFPGVTPTENLHFIDSDNYMGGVRMMSEIFRHGHRDILLFCSEHPNALFSAAKAPRVCGFHQVMLEHGVTDFEERTCYSAPESLEDAKTFLRTFLKKYPQTTLIATDSDNSAATIHAAALSLGIECPGKIALTGFGNITSLPIASVDQHPERQGELAARGVIEKFHHPESSFPLVEFVEASLVNTELIPIILN